MSQSPFPGGPQSSAWPKFIASFVYAFRGLWYAVRAQRNAKVHVIIAILAIVMGIALRISTVEFAIVFVVITGGFMPDLVNTLFALSVFLASPEYPPLAKVTEGMTGG